MNIGGTFWKLMNEGGPVMWPLLAFSVIAAAVVVERLIALRRARINVHEFLPKVRKALVVNRSIREAVKVCEEYRGPVASILKAGLMKYGQPKEDVEKTIENAALFEMGRLERGLAVLATTANVAPLLGFFGTVTGMMAGFDALAAQGLSNPGAVATGIKEALTTTAGGLAVAIPTQLAYNYFMSRINKFVRDIETSANMLLETFGEMERSGIPPESGGDAS
ncbi:MAG: MotA/TolQ/ExbB proton channel family protein [Acidobacteriota bacterium]|nr:MotA/TolQ/ExbB proton channel family protein [Acidobacteriota bacterium]MXW03292.1 MotA/TolQ/ExbB proton channel family protein [Holophagales bacterium]MCY3930319.1 MotA/TolQ/ExbB proton channel family protein [Acidobacteriota bacterium]MDE2850702.1 MotA/TolQ/ExbB proton channel family protein [Acidobacteriota bacterium]MDE2922817.1 MotA/TolQ/ExbB proton channel family protein [Acidobacteriota bacterium]